MMTMAELLAMTPTSSRLIQGYRKRLGISESADLSPSLEILQLLTELHLRCIPFENLSMHLRDPLNEAASNSEPPIVLERDLLIEKILVCCRGGCCLELNGLFGMLLTELGFPKVAQVPCFVHAGPERGHSGRKAKFRTRSSHFVLLVELNNGQLYIVDVGLGEPPLWPLRYVVDQVQTTPEGMASRIVWGKPWMDGQGRQRQCLIQEWWMQDTEEWTPRLQWDIADAPIHESLSVPVGLAKKHTLNSFQHVVDILLHPKSTFSRKAIVCILTRTEKISLSGRTLKITCPRFGPTRRSQAIELASDKQVLIVLKQYFGIELCQAKELDLSSSLDSANIRLWEHL